MLLNIDVVARQTGLSLQEVHLTKKMIKDNLLLIINKLVEHTMLHKLVIHQLAVDVLLVNNDKMQQLNQRFRAKNQVTNVISLQFIDFTQEETLALAKIVYLGEIIIAVPYVIQEAKTLKLQWQSHLIRLLIHGMLHLLGFDHQDDQSAKIMYDLESEILQQLGADAKSIVENYWD